jgi:cytochrome c-type biogenesis protein CcmH
MLCLLFAGAAAAIDAEPAFDDPALQARYEALTRELRCLVCQNQTVADSNAPLAADLRREVHDMLAAGRSDAEIREFMIERYGDFVLYRPRMHGVTLLLWVAPALLLAAGGFIAFRFIRRKAGEAGDEPADSEADSA